MLTEGQRTLLLPHGEQRMLGAAPQSLTLAQLGVVHHHRQAVRNLGYADMLQRRRSLTLLVLPYVQRRSGIRSKPEAVEEDVGRVLCWSPHALRVHVWDVCEG